MKRKPKPDKRKVISDAKLLKLWGNIVRERADWRCEYPDCTVHATQFHPHHFYSRRHLSIRYDPQNGLCLCAHHHTMGAFAAHSDPDFKDRIISTGVRTPEWREELIKKRTLIIANKQKFKEDAYQFLIMLSKGG